MYKTFIIHNYLINSMHRDIICKTTESNVYDKK